MSVSRFVPSYPPYVIEGIVFGQRACVRAQNLLDAYSGDCTVTPANVKASKHLPAKTFGARGRARTTSLAKARKR